MLVIGSMLGVLTLFKSRSEQGNSNHKPPASTPTVHGMAAFLMDATSGNVLVDVNSHAHLPIASTAKIMTAVVAIENANLDQPVTIKQATLDEVPQGMSTAQLQVGDQIQLRDLLYGLLLPSGSDAAIVIAHAVAGNTQNFVMMMNDEAHQLQLNDTHFSNPYGFSAPDDYSSAADLTRLARYAMQLSTFAQAVAEQEYVLSASSHNHRYLWHTTNTLLATYRGMNGIKTGYDVLAGACMVFSAQRNDRLLIGTVLHTQSENVLDSDVKKLLDRGFAS
jgi:D-alanyl-D-alanine carboxypeptidase